MKHLRESGGQFGDANITNNVNVYKSMSDVLPDIINYCKENEININELDSIKLMVFALSYIKKNDPSMNSERHIFSIFKLLESAYKKTIDFENKINDSIQVCDKLFNSQNILIVYGYIKGFQEALEYTIDK